MAVAARDIAITREDLAGWLEDYDGDSTIEALRAYIETKLTDAGYEDSFIDTSHRNDIPADQAAVIDLVMTDLFSYHIENEAYNAVF